jgi:hypothetical protein
MTFRRRDYQKQRWGTFHKRDDKNKNGELSRDDQNKNGELFHKRDDQNKDGELLSTRNTVKYKRGCLPRLGLAQLDGLGNLSLPGDGLG